MKCERARELFSEYLEGSIDHALTATVRLHIDQCAGCKRDLKMFSRTWDVIGSLPEVEAPQNLRHDVVMRVARIQHEQTKEAKQGVFGLSWDYLFGRLVPVRAIAVACAGAVLAALLLRVPQGVYDYVAQQMGGDQAIVSLGEERTPADAIEASTLYSNVKRVWQSRPLGRNTLWVSVAANEVGAGRSLYEVTLSLNQKAVWHEITRRIGARLYLLAPDQFSLDSEDEARLVWEGNVVADAPVVVPMILDRSRGGSGSANLLVRYRFRKRAFDQIVFIPTGNQRSLSVDTFGFSVGSGFRPAGNDLYSALQSLAQDYGVTIIANAQLDMKPSVVDLGSDSAEDALRKTLKPVGLTWAFIDEAVYVDREFKRLADFS